MSGAVIENLSGRKLAVLCAVMLLFLLTCFLVGGLVAPAPSDTQPVLGTICVDERRDRNAWLQVWSVPSQQRGCPPVASIEQLMGTGVDSEQVVFVFQMPLRKDGRLLDFTRWQQNLIGVLQLDIDYSDNHTLADNATITIDARLGYKNKHDAHERWQLLASSVERRPLNCELEPEHKYRYNCQLIPLFELGSLHHDFYLLNLRLPGEQVHIGKLTDIHLVAIYANGGFTKVWVTMKAVFFPTVVLLLVWFWRRVRQLGRPPALLECMLLALGVALSLLNLPLELLTLTFDVPYLLLITDVRQGVFYASLLSFWLVFAGEHLMISQEPGVGRLARYWRHLAAVATGCVSLFVFDMCERGVQLTNPFYSIWGTELGTRLALAFIIMAGVSAGLYFCFLCWMIWRVFGNISVKRQALPSMSSVRRLHYEGIIYRFKFLMLATLVCAAMTVIGFILGQVAEGQWKWDEDISLQYTSAVLCGVYGMWNVYTMAVICLYAPSHKRWPLNAAAGAAGGSRDSQAEEIEFSRLAPLSTSAEEPTDISSLTWFVRKQATD